jgi:hypothetical protein
MAAAAEFRWKAAAAEEAAAAEAEAEAAAAAALQQACVHRYGGGISMSSAPHVNALHSFNRQPRYLFKPHKAILRKCWQLS